MMRKDERYEALYRLICLTERSFVYDSMVTHKHTQPLS